MPDCVAGTVLTRRHCPVMSALRDLGNAGVSMLVLHHKPKNSASPYHRSSDTHSGADVNVSFTRCQAGGLSRPCNEQSPVRQGG